MADYLLLGLRILAGAGGLLLIAAAAFLYEGEEKQVQSVLEDWWVRIDDLGRTAVSRHVAFSVAAAKLTERTLNWFLGPSNYSWRAGSRVFFLSAALLGFQLGLIGYGPKFYLIGVIGLILCLVPTKVSLSACLIVVAVIPWYVVSALLVAFITGLLASFLVGVLSSLVLLAGTRNALRNVVEVPHQEAPLRRAFLLILPAVGGLIFLLLVKSLPHLLRALVRQSLSGFSYRSSALHSGLFSLSPARPEFMCGALTYSPLFLLAQGRIGDLLVNLQDWFLDEAIIRTNIVVCSQVGLLVLGLYLSFAVALGLHRVFWPLPNRILYAIQRTQLLQNHDKVWKIGLALLMAAAAPWVSVLEAVGAYF